MIRRSILFSLLICISSLLCAQQEQSPPPQPTLKRIGDFFKTKKGKALIAVTIVLLGGSAVWYLCGRSGVRVTEAQRNTDLCGAAVQGFCQGKFGKKVSAWCEFADESNVEVKVVGVKSPPKTVLDELRKLVQNYSMTVTAITYKSDCNYE